jgi:hypothetical protein
LSEVVIEGNKNTNIAVAGSSDDIKPFIYVLVLTSVCIILGFVWDISWHMSIGRDRFLTPPHITIYIGAIVAAIISGYQVLQRSFFGTAAQKAASVKFWGIFYGPFGGLFCIWGAFAMLTSSPFDNWWHNTFGLDQKIFSPPHVLLISGMIAIQLGTYISVAVAVSGKNFDAKINRKHNWLLAIAAGSMLATLFTLFSDRLLPSQMHGIWFFILSSIIFPVFMFAFSRASKSRWGATAAAAVYMGELLLMMWLFPLFPAKPQLGPVFNHFDHFQPFSFPLWLLLPAIAIDIILNRRGNQKPQIKILLASLAFILIFFVVQWYFGEFYHTSAYARGWVFASYSANYAAHPNSPYRYTFNPSAVTQTKHLVVGSGVAGFCALISGMAGFYWGSWIKKVQR